MSGPTPGPWSWDAGDIGIDYSRRYCTVSGPDGELVIAEVNDLFDRKIGQANARLIAAAPELLEAAKLVLAIPVDESTDHNMNKADRMVQQARAALAKATGDAT